MFPSPGRPVMALGHHGGGGQQAAASCTATTATTATTIAFSFQPSPPPATSTLPPRHHGILGYNPLVVLDHPTTATTASSSSSSHVPPSSTTIPSPTLHHLHAAPPPPRSSPPHPWSCEEGGRGRQRGKGAAMAGMCPVNDNGAGGSEGGGLLHGSAAAAAAAQHHQQQLGVGAVRMKKAGGKARRKVREPRFCFKTMSDVDVLDDGYKWRKYGQKVVKNTQHPRSYYRCTQDNCRVKKRVERLAEDPRMVITTYEGRHVHSPSRDDDDAARATAEMTFIW
ncbi:hypothetical protein GUJ93_ZPchr0001g32497 [Zizania palustris]|uniref:WRKY domain-containing protein n=1 Tax=Zizania palustris TaxID=103762 RepID=A0A8J5VMA0_ZIZPA|nr:hypothetical protein GUJ93_ZPchr0001g32497 [Zizania palustris]